MTRRSFLKRCGAYVAGIGAGAVGLTMLPAIKPEPWLGKPIILPMNYGPDGPPVEFPKYEELWHRHHMTATEILRRQENMLRQCDELVRRYWRDVDFYHGEYWDKLNERTKGQPGNGPLIT